MDFSQLSLRPELAQTLQQLNLVQMTPIQEKSLPLLLNGKDLLGQSKTGSGKTAAFALPILQNLEANQRQVQALVICPTRELVNQVVNEFRRLARGIEGVQVLALIGGVPGRPQAQALNKGVHIVVGTPGRILDLLQKRFLDLSTLKTLVLDEADKMFDMGFEEDVRHILQLSPKTRQTLFFSATYPELILKFSRQFQTSPQMVIVEEDGENVAAVEIEQILYEYNPEEKTNTLLRILQQHPASSCIIFCNMKTTISDISLRLKDQDVPFVALHGDLDQRERDRMMALFKNKSARIMVATDVAARGLDIQDLELVINFDLPADPETYVHRIGRTGRAGKTGTAITMTHPHEALKIIAIESFTGIRMTRGQLRFKNQFGLQPELRQAAMQTLMISGGRKDKLRPGDILGALTGEAGGLNADAIGKIEIMDSVSYVAISAPQASKALQSLRGGRIKGRKFPVRLVKS